jgi:hypothetical protein
LTSRPYPPRPHRLGNILEGLRSHIITGNLDLAPNLPIGIIGHEDAARFGDALKAGGNVDAIAEDVVVIENDVADVNADAEFDPLDLRHIDILFSHAALNFDGTAYGIHDAPELNEGAVPCILDDTSVMLNDFGIEKLLSKSFQLRQRAFFVDPYQAARASDIRRQNSRQSPLYVLAAQGAPRGSGKFNVL